MIKEQNMKKISFILVGIFLLTSKISYHSESAVDSIKKNNIFDWFNQGTFVKDNFTNWRMEHTLGRLSVLQHRISEIRGVSLANDLLNEMSSPQTILQLSPMYNKSDCTFRAACKIALNSKESNYLRILTSYVSFTEKMLYEMHQLNDQEVTYIEDMRLHDLYLLNEIIADESLPKNYCDIDSLSEMLRDTHAQWPPFRYKHILNVSSAFSIIENVLKMRKEAHINEKSDTYIWTFEAHKHIKDEYENSNQMIYNLLNDIQKDN